MSTSSLLVAIVALTLSLFLLTARHNAQLREQARVHNAQLRAMTEEHNAQLTAQAADCNKRVAELEGRFLAESRRSNVGKTAGDGTAARP